MFPIREPEFLHQLNLEYMRHWVSLRQNEILPRKTHFRPEDIPKLLPFFAIYELVSREFIKIRLAGTEMTRRHGFESTGSNYLDLVEPYRRPKASEAFWQIASCPCGMRVVLQHRYAGGIIRETEALGLPVRNDQGDNPLLYYTVCPIEREGEPKIDLLDRTQVLTVLDREFIDLGAGTPEFQD